MDGRINTFVRRHARPVGRAAFRVGDAVRAATVIGDGAVPVGSIGVVVNVARAVSIRFRLPDGGGRVIRLSSASAVRRIV